MSSLTGTELARGVFQILNVFAVGAGESIPAADGEAVRTAANDLLSEWSTGPLFIPVISRERFDLVANKGGEDNPYTIGPGGDFDTIRPATQKSITQANLILTTSTPEVRVPLGIYTDDGYDANQLPGMSNGQPTGIYYNPTYDDDLGSLYLWPVPNVNTNDLELFIQQPVPEFANLSTAYFLPPGLPRALKYSVADTLSGDYGRTLTPSQERIRVSSLNRFKRSNRKMGDMANDILLGVGSRTLYNINTNGGGN